MFDGTWNNAKGTLKNLGLWGSLSFSLWSIRLISDVNGIYTSPPGTDGARFLSTYCPISDSSSVAFGGKSRVGLGGMDSKVSRCRAKRVTTKRRFLGQYTTWKKSPFSTWAQLPPCVTYTKWLF